MPKEQKVNDGKRFIGKTALITGGGAGFGRATGLRLAYEGAAVGIADIVYERVKAVQSEIETQGGRAVAIQCDVTDEKSCRQAVDTFGRVDCLFTSAGIHDPAETVVDTTEEMWERSPGCQFKRCIPYQ